jgi:hypothetical protein
MLSWSSGELRPEFRFLGTINQPPKALLMRRRSMRSAAQLASCSLFATMPRAKTATGPKTTGRLIRTASSAPKRWRVRRLRPSRGSCGRLLTRPIGARGTGNTVGRGSRCAGSGNAPSSPFLAAYSTTTGCDGSAPRAGRQRIRPCCSARLRTISRSCSSISQHRHLEWRLRSIQQE